MVDNRWTPTPSAAPAHRRMPWRNSPRSRRTPPAGFIQPCQPTLVAYPPAGPGWLHEMKHDGYRLIARKDAGRVRPVVPLRNRLHRQAAENRRGGRSPHRRQRPDRRRGGGVSPGRAFRFCRAAHQGRRRTGLIGRVRPSQPQRATISASNRSRTGARRSSHWSPESTASSSAQTSRATARSCSLTPASSAWRGSCRSASQVAITAGRAATGSSA